jgi:hypothetical protein
MRISALLLPLVSSTFLHKPTGDVLSAQAAADTRNDGKKYALQWIVQNSYDAWMKMLGLPQTPIWQY